MDYAASFAYFLTLLLNTAPVEAPPKEIKTDADLLRTCIYIHSQVGISPSVCQRPFTAVAICSNDPNPTEACFNLVGVNKVNPHNEDY